MSLNEATGKLEGESEAMYQHRKGMLVALAALTHTIRLIPNASFKEAETLIGVFREAMEPKDRDSAEYAALMAPLNIVLGHAQVWDADSNPLLTVTNENE